MQVSSFCAVSMSEREGGKKGCMEKKKENCGVLHVHLDFAALLLFVHSRLLLIKGKDGKQFVK